MDIKIELRGVSKTSMTELSDRVDQLAKIMGSRDYSFQIGEYVSLQEEDAPPSDTIREYGSG